MSLLNNKFEKIITDSDIYFYKDEIENEIKIEDKMFDEIEMRKVFNKMWDNLPYDANIAIYGLGNDSYFLFDVVDLAMKNVVCMIDNNPEITNFKGYPVIRSNEISLNKINIVITTSRIYADEMKFAVEAVAPDCKIMHIWDELDSKNYFYSDLNMLPKKRFCDVFLLDAAVLYYNANRDVRYLLFIIYSYLKLRDLQSALVFIDKYINANYSNVDKMLDLKNNLHNLLDEIKQKLAAKQNSHTLILIADAMTAKDINSEQTPFLHALGQNNICCSNAYSNTGWTTTSILTIFTRKSFIDNNLYKSVPLTETEALFEYVKKNNIDFAYYWPYMSRKFTEKTTGVFNYNYDGCASIMWQYLCSAFEYDKKALYFLHFSETHEPNLCLYHVDGIKPQYNTYTGCVKYVDSQTEFLFNLLPSNTKLLFCSDHGRGLSNPKRKSLIAYHINRYNIPYIICDRKTHSGADKRLVSHLDTLDILINLINDMPAFENINHRTLAETNEEFLYSEYSLKTLIKIYGKLKAFCANKSFISDKDRYIISYDGEEGYFLLTDDTTNLIDDPAYADRINWFRENVNTEFPDWRDDNGRYDITRKYFDVDKEKVHK